MFFLVNAPSDLRKIKACLDDRIIAVYVFALSKGDFDAPDILSGLFRVDCGTIWQCTGTSAAPSLQYTCGVRLSHPPGPAGLDRSSARRAWAYTLVFSQLQETSPASASPGTGSPDDVYNPAADADATVPLCRGWDFGGADPG